MKACSRHTMAAGQPPWLEMKTTSFFQEAAGTAPPQSIESLQREELDAAQHLRKLTLTLRCLHWRQPFRDFRCGFRGAMMSAVSQSIILNHFNN